ncbi:putative sulfate exporter family transporter [Chloroflexia bacterium SDU3-3]|nr:putative sulfate exporter family transporter [Chloroflexia bacterium SDU3-3]
MQRYLPGLWLAGAIALFAWLLQLAEERVFGHAAIEALVIALLLGIAWRAARGLHEAARPGVAFAGKQLLEFAVLMLGATINVPMVLKAGPVLLGAIVAVVVLGISFSALIGRAVGLRPKLATLVAVGNSICGNSAIAAVAPVIDAEPDDVASSIALTAILGVAVILLLPLLIPLLHLSFYQYGVLAGMTVYAVPQVLAATFPVSQVSGEIGTLVKLVRVLMLGPVVLFFSLRRRAPGQKIAISRLVPWFIVGFLIMAAVRSVGLFPASLSDAVGNLSRILTVVAMAALGLEVNLPAVRRVGPQVAVAVVGSLLALLAVALTLILGLGIGAGM